MILTSRGISIGDIKVLSSVVAKRRIGNPSGKLKSKKKSVGKMAKALTRHFEKGYIERIIGCIQ